uniref:Uncharacterized protein LOC100376421 n=1 Tax=Saccoglossus kowalevskii TaxID=10224 RepID=A0ABM0MAQ2_SACKO|nr:PREDICTED: uncharacterized protein LOC100376421 [Saccoglossus kowalevskii]
MFSSDKLRVVYILVVIVTIVTAKYVDTRKAGKKCPPGVPELQCSIDPCEVETCPLFPRARCVANFCGGCNAVFYHKGKEVDCTVDKPGECPIPQGGSMCVELCGDDEDCDGTMKCCSTGCGHVCMEPDDNGCWPGVPMVYCFADPCRVTECPAYPEAKCVANYCGGCNADFYVDGELVDCIGEDCDGHEDGTTYPADDGCNTCTCNNGREMCTLMVCGPDCHGHVDGTTYSAGDGCNTCANMMSSSQILPSGIPLHFTVKATNSAKSTSMATCVLPTYDTTLPSGRILSTFKSTSRPDILKGSVVITDDSPISVQMAKQLNYYERNGVSRSMEFEHRNLNLRHGDVHYFNMYLQNTLGYETIINSGPIVADFETPSTGPIQNTVSDIKYNASCESFVPSKWHYKCIEARMFENHRHVVDGPGSATVFNGQEPLVDLLYTRSNKFVTANWDGFHDDETGILGYTWAVGTDVCQEDIHPHTDPHEWTNKGIAHSLSLPDGFYYVTVRAINNVEFGGPLATTVCHSTPLAIDNTPPYVHDIFNIEYDEDTCIISEEYNFDLRAVRYGLMPLIVDTSPPTTGNVFDGLVHDHDINYQFVSNEICVSWSGFQDQESSIEKYIWFVGTTPGANDTIEPIDLSYTEYRTCQDNLVLEHNTTYYNTIVAVNMGHKKLTTKVTTDGFLCDETSPLVGWIHDGLNADEDIEFTSEASTVSANWGDFYDPESNIDNYFVNVWRKHADDDGITAYPTTNIHGPESLSGATSFINWHHFHLHHGDFVYIELEAVNGALNSIVESSDGVFVDLTEPLFYYLYDSDASGNRLQQYTSSETQLSASWEFGDQDSGVESYRISIFQTYGGLRYQIYPAERGSHATLEGAATSWTSQDSLELINGAHYSLRIIAVNGAGLSNVQDTDGVIVDTSPPKMRQVSIGVQTANFPEEVIDGKVLQSDTEGIVAYWMATDFESGISEYLLCLGTTEGGSDILADKSMGSTEGGYIGGINLELELINHKLYYLSVRARNGAGTLSDYMTSSPIKVVAKDKVGFVKDGPNDPDTDNPDVDYQKETGTVTARFTGFESAQHGIVHYEWAVGTAPRLDDIQPYVSYGVFIEEDVSGSVGHSQSLLPLNSGSTYYTTIRAITGAGNVLDSTSDGFTVDTTPPSITITSAGRSSDNETAYLSNNNNIYQSPSDSFLATWDIFEEESAVSYTEVCYGSYPGGNDIHSCTDATGLNNLLNAGVWPETTGVANFISITSKNRVGLKSTTISNPIITDTTPPVAGTVECQEYLTSSEPISCAWENFEDTESGISHYIFGIGISEGDDSLFSFTIVPANTDKISVEELTIKHHNTYYATVFAVNNIGSKTAGYSKPITFDDTPPIAGTVVVLSGIDTVYNSTENVTHPVGCEFGACVNPKDAVCQTSFDRIFVTWQQFEDFESPIVRYQIAAGTSPGGTQLRDFFDTTSLERQAMITGLSLYTVKQAYVSVRGFNAVGQYNTSISNAVYISRVSANLPPIGESYVWDGRQDGDLDYQGDEDELSGHWNFNGDPCPIATYEWSIMRFDGTVITPMMLLPVGSTYGLYDGLNMKDGESFYIVVRATNLLGFTYSLRSDGITIQKESLLPGNVRDGDIWGYDLNSQASVTYLAANWDGFGIDGTGTQEIEHYEIAAGTDRRYPTTRYDIQPFTNVALNTSYTFHDLRLVPRRLTYYITVRAFSVSTSMAEVTSNGIKVGYGGQAISKGEIHISRFVASTNTVSLSWNDFEFGMPVMFYQLGIGHSNEEWNMISCKDLQIYNDDGHLGQNMKFSHMFDQYPLTNVGKDTTMQITNLLLENNETYTVVVIATDESAECMLSSVNITVDLTPPKEGVVLIGAFPNLANAYTDRNDRLSVSWHDYYDMESGIESYAMTLYDGVSCGYTGKYIVLQNEIKVPSTDSSYTFIDVDLQPERPYYVQLSAINNAGLHTTTISKPILLDLTDPIPGIVKDGISFKTDITYQSDTNRIEGAFLHRPTSEGDACPSLQFSMEDQIDAYGWASVNMKGVWGVGEIHVMFRESQLSFGGSDGMAITLSRDVKDEQVYSGAYTYNNPGIAEGGRYKFDMIAANGDIPAVTSVIFWDGPDGVVGDFNAPIGEKDWADNNREYDNCALCCVYNDTGFDNDNSGCDCNCTVYFQRTTILATTTTETTTATIEPLATTSLPWAIVEDDNPDYTYTGEKSFKHITHQSMGIQLHPDIKIDGDIKHYIVLWFKFKNDTDEVQYDITELEFDPSDSWHSYILDVVSNMEEMSIQLLVDDNPCLYLSGLPSFSETAKFILTSWNRDGVVPDIDRIFTPPNSVAHFRNIRFPPESSSLCRFGAPFRNGDNSIVAFYAGVGSARLLDDIVPFREVARPCQPCALSCGDINCDGSCLEDITTEFKVVLDGLQLTPTSSLQYNEPYNNLPSIYHLSIKALTGSGRYVVASSDGVYIDDSPPVFNYLYHVDMSRSEDETITYQGSNSTIAVKWSAYDIGSQLYEFRWAIGSEPYGTDIQSFLSVGVTDFVENSGLFGLIEDGNTYFVTVEAVNNAGMTTVQVTSGVTLVLTSPNIDATKTVLSCDNMDTSVPGLVLCGDQSNIGMMWDRIDDDSINGYFFSIGSAEDSMDIFPELQVGLNNSGEIQIRDGYVYIGDEPLYNMSSLRRTNEGIAGNNDALDTEFGDIFHMEPGRILFLKLTACNKVHKCGVVSLVKSTIIREDDTMRRASDNSTVVISLQEKNGIIKNDTRRTVSIIGLFQDITQYDPLDDGRVLIAGMLSQEDLVVEYASDASPDFNPYIVNPETTKEESDRFLKERIKDIVGPSFFVSYPGDQYMGGPLYISVSVDKDVLNVTDDVPRPHIIFWHTELQQWKDASHTCEDSFGDYTTDLANSLLTVKVCSTKVTVNSPMKRRSTGNDMFTGSSEFTVATIGTFVNSPPRVTSQTNMWMSEDSGTLFFSLKAVDREGDIIIFKLDSSFPETELGTHRLSSDGNLSFRPCLDCFGIAQIHFLAVEERYDEFEVLSTPSILVIDIHEINDNPVIFLTVNHVTETQGPRHSYTLEQHKTTDLLQNLFDGIVGAFDVDNYDSITFLFDHPKHGQLLVGNQINQPTFTYQDCSQLVNITKDVLTYENSDCNLVMFPCGLHIPHDVDQLAWAFRAFRYIPDDNYFGKDTFEIVAIDTRGTYSEVLIVDVYILSNPCMNGAACQGPATDIDCTGTDRSNGFSGYECVCLPGYTGEYCEQDVNECEPNPCEYNYTCTDQVNGFICHCDNYEWPCGKEETSLTMIIVGVCAGLIFFILNAEVDDKGNEQEEDVEGGATTVEENDEGEAEIKLVMSVPQRFGFVERPNLARKAWGRGTKKTDDSNDVTHESEA